MAGIWLWPGSTKLLVVTGTQANWNFYIDIPPVLDINVWTHVVVSVGKAVTVYFNGKRVGGADIEPGHVQAMFNNGT